MACPASKTITCSTPSTTTATEFASSIPATSRAPRSWRWATPCRRTARACSASCPAPACSTRPPALATAYATGAKVLCLAGQIPSRFIGKGIGLLHELPDQAGILARLTKWSTRIDSPAEAPARVAEAFRQLSSGRPRPVGLECAMDVLAREERVGKMVGPLDPEFPALDAGAIESAAKIITEAKKPLIFVGSGALGAAPLVEELAEWLQAPVFSYRSGRGIVSSRHYLSHPLPAAHGSWPEADVAIALGCRMQVPLMRWGVDDDLAIVQVDVDPGRPRPHRDASGQRARPLRRRPTRAPGRRETAPARPPAVSRSRNAGPKERQPPRSSPISSRSCPFSTRFATPCPTTGSSSAS